MAKKEKAYLSRFCDLTDGALATAGKGMIYQSLDTPIYLGILSFRRCLQEVTAYGQK